MFRLLEGKAKVKTQASSARFRSPGHSNIDGAERVRRRLTTNDTTISAIIVTPTMTPMTPPAMALASELRCEVGVDPDALGVKVDWVSLQGQWRPFL